MTKAMIFDINQNEYGIKSIKTGFASNIYFQPSEFDVLDNYLIIKELYKV